jgi:hypothetical protein
VALRKHIFKSSTRTRSISAVHCHRLSNCDSECVAQFDALPKQR